MICKGTVGIRCLRPLYLRKLQWAVTTVSHAERIQLYRGLRPCKGPCRADFGDPEIS